MICTQPALHPMDLWVLTQFKAVPTDLTHPLCKEYAVQLGWQIQIEGWRGRKILALVLWCPENPPFVGSPWVVGNTGMYSFHRKYGPTAYKTILGAQKEAKLRRSNSGWVLVP